MQTNNYFKKFQLKQRRLKRMASVLLLSLLNQVFYPVTAWALTGGPSQPEVKGFEPVGASNMVDLFTGDMSYNLPLMDVGGYPLNLAYRAGASMDEEASWVGLGWSLNPGVLNREMRGIPDDFNGDMIQKDFHMAPDITTSFQVSLPIQLFGKYVSKLTNKFKGNKLKINSRVKIGGTYSNYTGFGLNMGLGIAASWENTTTTSGTTATNGTWTQTNVTSLGNAGLNLGYGAKSGMDIQPSVGLASVSNNNNFKLTASGAYNSRQGLRALTLSADIQDTKNPGEKNEYTMNQSIGSGTLDFAAKTYVPAPKMPIVNKSYNFHGTVGGEIFGVHPNFQLQGSYSKQALERNTERRQSYGYLHEQHGKKDPYSVLDYNQERPIVYRPSQPKLPLSYGTYDLFSASGQGVSGQFRPMRNDVGSLRQPQQQLQSTNAMLGIEIGFGNLGHGGFEFKPTTIRTKGSDWSSDKGAAGNMEFSDLQASRPDYEPVYFKNVGEPASEQPSEGLRQILSDKNPVALDLQPDRQGARAAMTLRNGGSIPQNVQRATRQKRNQVLSYLSAREATTAGLDKQILNFPAMDTTSAMSLPQPSQRIERTSHPAHHISEATVTQNDGSRYIYGIPAYNQFQKEVTFSTGLKTATNGIITYDETDNTLGNKKARENFYDAQTLPKYAHSFLLTSILSPDYVDVGNDGISDNDIGTAVKLNYSRVHTDYGWRTPYGDKKARYQEGLRHTDRDDKGHYIYGQKEIWYVHSVETKMMVAQFFTSDREDALGVADENGAKDVSKRLKKLDKIVLYSKADLIRDAANAVPVKTVHFKYNYQSCQGIQNSISREGGKLTLKEVYFTYGKNTGGLLNKYKFNYYNEGTDGMYSLENYDRWGNYKPANANLAIGIAANNADYPYAAQTGASAQAAADAWNLKEVILPSGGTINVTYEPDDYAYVQNKRAGQMFPVVGFSSNPNGSYETNLFLNGHTPRNFVVVQLPRQMSGDEFRRNCLQDLDKLYFNFLLKFKDLYESERLQGYVVINKEGATTSGSLGYIPVETISGNLGYKYHPIYKIAIQKLRLEMPFLLNPEQDMTQAGDKIAASVRQIFGIFPDIYRRIRGMDAIGVEEGLCKRVICNQSWVRLMNPDLKKLGGGHRVKSVKIKNYWGAARSNPNDNEYGQTYAYHLDGQPNASSGVAAYEPSIGGDENPFRKQLAYTQNVALAPDNTYYLEEPIGESLFPAPTVGYSRVAVSNLNSDNQQLSRTGTGTSVHEFFTAKDFPTFVEQTDKQQALYKPSVGQLLLSFFKFDKREMLGVSQGYTIETNDMHGKPKKEHVLNALGAEVSWTKYEYRRADANKLNNDGIPMVRSNGSIQDGSIGVDMDVWQETQEELSEQEAQGMSFNTEVFMLGLIPIVLPPMWPFAQRETKQFRTAVTTKYIKRFGILDKVTKMENGATVETQNQLWDAETGQVLLTRTQNEFKDYLYQFSLPAHWVYDAGMGMAYKNLGMVLQSVVLSNGNVSPFAEHLVEGDDVMLMQGGNMRIGTVLMINNTKQIMDPSGRVVPDGTYDIKIVRSGRRNQQSASIGSLVSRSNPVQSNQLNINNLANVITAQAATFRDDWAVRGGVKLDCATGAGLNLQNDTHFKQFLRDLLDKKAENSTLPLSAPATVSSVSGNNLGQVFSRSNSEVNLVEMPFVPLVAPPQVPQPLYSSYQVRIGEDCMLELKPEVGNTFNFEYYSKDRYQPIQTLGNNRWRILWTPQSLIATLTCTGCRKTCIADLAANDVVNPYRLGMKGNWRPWEAFALYAKRTIGNDNITELRTAGNIPNFANFWRWQNNQWVRPPATDRTWVRTTEITQVDNKGNEVETRDALGIHSSALYRYKNTLAAAVTANARLRQTAFDGFEDYTFLRPEDNCYPEHWDFASTNRANVVNEKAHSGKFALKVMPNTSISKNTAITPNALTTNDLTTPVVQGNVVQRVFPTFGLSEGTYLISAWVAANAVQELNAVTLNVNGVTLQPTGAIVEGWQRIEGTFPVANGVTNINIQLTNGLNVPLYVDDIRILPFNAKMKSFVYDARTLRLMAQLDENNYATFYEYDDEGSLVRTKRETERGVMTLQENRNYLRPSN